MTIKDIHEKIISKEVSIEEVVKAYLNRAKKTEDFNAFITVCENEALSKAKGLDQKLDKLSPDEKKSLSMLYGIPYSAKDIFLTKGIRTTNATKILDNFIPPYSATVIDKLNNAGAVLVGKANHDPFGFGSSTENSDYGVVKNAYDKSRVAGGSSGGSAVSVALESSVFSMGTDTGGSCRQPASFNNVVGLKPTYGRVTRYGVIAYGSSLDTIGHLAKTVEDSAIVLNETAGNDSHDATSSTSPVPDYLQDINKDITGLKIGVPREFLSGNIDGDVKQVFENSLKTFEKLGAEVIEISLSMLDYAASVYYILATAEASSNLARFDGVRFGMSNRTSQKVDDIYLNTRGEYLNDEIKRRIILGTYALSAGYYDEYYKKALKMRTLVIEDYNKAFENVDIIIAPVFPIPAFKVGAFEDDPIKLWLSDLYTVTLNVFGGPGLAIPAGFTDEELPVGIQLIGPHFAESKLFNAGHLFETETKFFEKSPHA